LNFNSSFSLSNILTPISRVRSLRAARSWAQRTTLRINLYYIS